MKALVILFFVMLPNFVLSDEIVVITHPEFNQLLTKSDLINVYMGRTKTLKDGENVYPLDHSEDSKTREEFYQWLVNKSANEIKSYWSRLIFSGRARPPTEAKDAQAMIAIVKNNPRTIGYIDKKFVTKEVKILESAQ